MNIKQKIIIDKIAGIDNVELTHEEAKELYEALKGILEPKAEPSVTLPANFREIYGPPKQEEKPWWVEPCDVRFTSGYAYIGAI